MVFDGEWTCLGIESGGAMVGHVMWAVDPEDGSTWIGGFVVDHRWQRRGVGSSALGALIDRFTVEGRLDLALSYSPENAAAQHLYLRHGFVETGETEDDEIVARLRR
jgi:diamine N-acetyltransferase